jgi:MarC family membrane protein
MEAAIISLPMPTELLSAVILLTLVIDPFGNVPLVNAMLATVPRERRTRVILREVAIALVTLALFMRFGREILLVMHLSETSLAIAGGVILFMIAIRMVFGHPEGLFGDEGRGGEPYIVPLAIPLIAGPSAVATVMLMASRDPGKLMLWAAALGIAMAITAVVLASGEQLQRRLGDPMMKAVERLMGLVLTAIAVEMLLDGISVFWKTLR